jgi:peptidyl-prolyl cis-trans isomerase D
MGLNTSQFPVIFIAAKDRRGTQMVMKLLRKRMKIVIWIAATAFVALIFLSWGMDITRRSPTGMLQRGFVGKVNDRMIRIETYREMLRRTFMNMRTESGADVDGLTSTLLEDRIFEEIVQEELMRQEIERRGITTSDAEVIAFIKSVPPEGLRSDTSFVTDGEFDVEKYQRIFQNPANLPWLVEYEAYVRQALPKQKLMLTLYSTARLTDLEIGDAYTERHAKVKLKYLLVTTERAGSVQATEEDARRYYKEHASDFELPETAQLAYVHFSTSPSPSDSAVAVQDVNGVYEELKAGADFGKLAGLVSQDDQTAQRGGLVGWIKRGEVIKVFEDAAFALRKGQVSEPLLSEYGWHIIMVDEKRADSVRVSHILIRPEASDETIDRARENAALFREDAAEMGFQSAAVSHGVDVQQTQPFSGQADFIPEIGYSRVITDFAFESQPEKLSRVFATGQGFYVVKLTDRKESHVPSFESLSDTLTNLALREKQLAQAGVVADSASALLTDGLSMENVGRRLDLEYEVTGELTIANARPRYPLELIGASAALADDQVSRPVRTARGYYILQVLERIPPDVEMFERLSTQLAGNLIDAKQRRIVDEWLASLRDRAKITDYRSEIYQ